MEGKKGEGRKEAEEYEEPGGKRQPPPVLYGVINKGKGLCVRVSLRLRARELNIRRCRQSTLSSFSLSVFFFFIDDMQIRALLYFQSQG